MAKRYRIELGYAQRISIILVGCGGTGSFLALHLARMAYHARERRGLGIQMLFVDPDQVEEKNIGRQNFCCAEVGRNKAVALATRYSRAFGLEIGYLETHFEPVVLVQRNDDLTLVCGCVDNAQARQEIAEAVTNYRRTWWLDGGNHDHSGQVLLGDRPEIQSPDISPLGVCVGLPLPSVQCPELISPTPALPRAASTRTGEGVSCADLALADVQGLMVNQAVAGWMAVYASRLLVSRDLDMMATYFDLASGSARSVGIESGAGRAA
jgi:PRTRC genetic system ThiF family protein